MISYISTRKCCVFPVLVVFAALAIGCGSSASGDPSVGSARASTSPSPHVLTTTKAKQLMLTLPYRYKWRHRVALPEGASGALAGTAIGGHHTALHFGISLGTEAGAVPVPNAGLLDPYDYSEGGGFIFNDDLEVPGKNETVHPGKQFHTAAQWDEATTMEVEMEEKLCKASTGRPCPS